VIKFNLFLLKRKSSTKTTPCRVDGQKLFCEKVLSKKGGSSSPQLTQPFDKQKSLTKNLLL